MILYEVQIHSDVRKRELVEVAGRLVDADRRITFDSATGVITAKSPVDGKEEIYRLDELPSDAGSPDAPYRCFFSTELAATAFHSGYLHGYFRGREHGDRFTRAEMYQAVERAARSLFTHILTKKELFAPLEEADKARN